MKAKKQEFESLCNIENLFAHCRGSNHSIQMLKQLNNTLL